MKTWCCRYFFGSITLSHLTVSIIGGGGKGAGGSGGPVCVWNMARQTDRVGTILVDLVSVGFKSEEQRNINLFQCFGVKLSFSLHQHCVMRFSHMRDVPLGLGLVFL